MKASEIRSRILADHAVLRRLLDAVDGLALRVLAGDGDAIAMLRERGLELHRKLCEHLDLEDRLLIPAVRDSGISGEEQAEQIVREHTEQRLLLEYILGRLRDQRRPTLVLGRELHSFVNALLEDMTHEEKTVLNDGFSTVGSG